MTFDSVILGKAMVDLHTKLIALVASIDTILAKPPKMVALSVQSKNKRPLDFEC